MKSLFLLAVLALLPGFGFAIQNSSIPQYTHPAAKSFCESLGKRLPTSREMAQFGMDHGARGLLEPADYKGQDGYSEIRRTTADYHAELDFYYSSEGYVSPEREETKPWLWTSSYGPHNIDFAYVFNLETGAFDFDARIMLNGVRCR